MTTTGNAPDLLRAMIGIDSVNRAISGRPAPEAEFVAYLEGAAAALGLVTQRLPVPGEAENLLVTAPVRVDAPWLLFESHLDTVGVEGMIVPPFRATDTPGRIHGRGACDTKASGAAILRALADHAAALAAGGTGLNGAVVFTVDEEIARAGIHRFVDHHLPALGWWPAAVVVGEPTRLRPVVAHNGVVRVVIRTTGHAAHSSNPSLGRSAISAMLPIVTRLEHEVIPAIAASHPLTGRAVGSVNTIRGGEQVNIIPAWCEIQLDRRTVPGEDGWAVLAGIGAFLDDCRAADPRLEVALDPIVHQPLDPATNGAWAAIVGATLERMGRPGAGIGVGYGTDASEFERAGIPALVLGPGDIAQAHAADEWVEIDELQAAVEIYGALLRGEVPGPV
ncbi:MAG: M20/M25/M40 family metallo-hydrolase [Chloroflexota bacterium]